MAFDEQIASHSPIHDDAYKWEDFKELLRRGEYEEDKIYFISDIDTQAEFLERLLIEIKNATDALEVLVGDN